MPRPSQQSPPTARPPPRPRRMTQRNDQAGDSNVTGPAAPAEPPLAPPSNLPTNPREGTDRPQLPPRSTPPRCTQCGPQDDGSGEDFDFSGIPGDPSDSDIPAVEPIRPRAIVEPMARSSTVPSQQTSSTRPSSERSTTSRTAAHDINHFFERGSKAGSTKTVCKVCRY